ncbi:MAG: hypothetical protein WDO13_12995 [Verrucomicrobiota bacterium]
MKYLAALCLLTLLIAPAGCASSEDTTDDSTLQASPEKGGDDHGWGTSIGGMGGGR